MLRELQTASLKNVDAMYKAGADLVTGMAVVKNYTTKTVELPGAATVDGFFFVMKERIPTGINCARTDMSDYDVDFTDIKTGEPVKLITPTTGERYGVDQFVATGLVEGNSVMVGVDGKFAKATVASKYIYGGTVVDNGHTLAVIEVSDKLVTNA